MRSAMVLCALLLVSACAGEARGSDASARLPWTECVLDNGVRVLLAHAPDAPRQTFFSLLPHGLVDDPIDRAQLAHAVEHALVRTTDAELGEPALLVNGETTAVTLRLETHAEPARWREALARHATWLAARSFAPESIEREKARIADEERATVERGATHKWAAAAWNQVVRHGRSTASVHGDLARATAADVERWIDERLSAQELVFASVGPVDPAEIERAVRGALGALERRAPTAVAPALRPLASGDLRATWDLDARHLLAWRALPSSTAAERAAGSLLVQALNAELLRSNIARSGVSAFAESWRTPEGSWLVLSASLPEGLDPVTVRGSFEAVLARVREGRGALPLGGLPDSFRRQVQAGVDLAALRRGRAARGLADELLEAQVLLGLIQEELLSGVRLADSPAAYAELGGPGLLRFARAILGEGGGSTLLLEPGSPPAPDRVAPPVGGGEDDVRDLRWPAGKAPRVAAFFSFTKASRLRRLASLGGPRQPALGESGVLPAKALPPPLRGGSNRTV